MPGYTDYDTWVDDSVHTATNIISAWMEHYEYFASQTTVTEDVWRVFMRFRNVDPAAIEGCLADLRDVEMTVASHVDLLADAKDRVLKNWSGTAAQGFCDYLNAMAAALNNIRDRVMALALIAQAELQLACDYQTDVNSLVQKTLQGIQDAEVHQEKMALAIAGSLAAAVASIAAGPEAGPVVVGVISALTSGTASVASEALDADSVYDVVFAFIAAGQSLAGDCAGQGFTLIQGLDKVMEYVTEDHLPEVRPDRPEVITAPSFDPKAFYPEGADSSTLPSVSTTDLVPEPAQHGDQQSDHVGGEGRKDITIFGNKVGEIDTGPARDLYPEQGPAA